MSCFPILSYILPHYTFFPLSCIPPFMDSLLSWILSCHAFSPVMHSLLSFILPCHAFSHFSRIFPLSFSPIMHSPLSSILPLSFILPCHAFSPVMHSPPSSILPSSFILPRHAFSPIMHSPPPPVKHSTLVIHSPPSSILPSLIILPLLFILPIIHIPFVMYRFVVVLFCFQLDHSVYCCLHLPFFSCLVDCCLSGSSSSISFLESCELSWLFPIISLTRASVLFIQVNTKT